MTTLEWKTAESLITPLALDTTISKDYVYLRKDIKVVEVEDGDGKKHAKYVYSEATIAREEFLALGSTSEKAIYELALQTPVEYPENGHIYKPEYLTDYFKEMESIKTPLQLIQMCGGDISEILKKTVNIYDATGKVENRVSMNVLELSNLYFFLYLKKEELYNEYREAILKLIV